MTQADAADAARFGSGATVPAYAYLGPLLFVLAVTGVFTAAYSMAFSFLVPVFYENGLSAEQIGFVSTVGGTLLWLVSTILAVLIMYFSARRHMGWFKFLMSPGGRATRADYWLKYWIPFFLFGLIAVALLTLVIAPVALFADIDSREVGAVLLAQVYVMAIRVDLLLFWPWFAVMAKRLHDRGKSAWFLLILLIPIVGPIWLFIEVALLRGQRGDNRYGPDPLAA
jgi:uncharacterized membrane protein YhaH (DUF805 family)